MLIDALYTALVFINLVLLSALYWFGPRILILARVAILLNAFVLVIFLIPLVTLLFDPRAPPESSTALRILFPTTGVLLVQFVAMVLLFRRALHCRRSE